MKIHAANVKNVKLAQCHAKNMHLRSGRITPDLRKITCKACAYEFRMHSVYGRDGRRMAP